MANRERLTKTLMDLIRIDSPTGEEDAVDREVSVRLQALASKSITTLSRTLSPSWTAGESR